MLWRCRSDPSYQGKEVRLTRNHFFAWAEGQVRNFLYFRPDGCPSLDRIDPDGHYEIGNIRVIDADENRVRSRFIATFLRLDRYDPEDRVRVLARNIIATCQNAGVDKNRLVTYLKTQI